MARKVDGGSDGYEWERIDMTKTTRKRRRRRRRGRRASCVSVAVNGWVRFVGTIFLLFCFLGSERGRKETLHS